MPATITDTLRQQIARDFFERFEQQTHNYYVGIGRSQPWDSQETVPTPINSPEEVTKLRNALQSIKKVKSTSLVVPRNNWSNGAIYSPYDDARSGYPTQPYYVKNDNNQVYVCLETGRNRLGVAQPSTVEPTGSNHSSFRTADGYVWKFMYTISGARQEQFQSSNFMPVQKQYSIDSNSTGIELKQKAVQDSAVGGEVLSIVLTNPGSGYTSIPTVTISGNGTDAKAVADIDSATGEVSRIRIKDSAHPSGPGTTANLAHGSGYTIAFVTITGGGGTGAKARAILPFSDSGVGADARIDLKSASVMFHTLLEGNDSDFLLGQDFRQVTLFKDPLNRQGAKVISNTASCLDYMRLSSTLAPFTKDKVIEGQTTFARAYIDDIDSDKIYFHQDAETGFTAFQDGEIIEETTGPGQGIIDSALILSEVDRRTGDILYIDNRAPVERTAAQSEDIKIILQF